MARAALWVAGVATLLITLHGLAHADEATVSDTLIAERLMSGYPEIIEKVADNQLTFSDGTSLNIRDGGPKKNHQQWLTSPDIADMFRYPYHPNSFADPERLTGPAEHSDPGRARNTAFFRKVYGDCSSGEVRPHLERVAWLPDAKGKTTYIQVTRRNQVARRLAAVVALLTKLPPERRRFLVPPAGGYNCRTIAGTNTPSAHSYGIAVDIAVRHADYWRWKRSDAREERRGGAITTTYRNQIPYDIVAAFEAHGFIWGGRWSHFDTMHFEYRPELLPPTVSLPALAPTDAP